MRRHWCSGNIGASQALAPGSIPGWRTVLLHVYPDVVTHNHSQSAYLLGLLAQISVVSVLNEVTFVSSPRGSRSCYIL